jgi:hypothetical protein
MTKMTREAAISFVKAINNLPRDVKFSKHLLFAISKTKKTVLDELKEIGTKEEALYTEAFKKITEDRRKLVESFAEKAEDGSFISTNNNLTFTKENEVLLAEAVKKFDKDNKKIIDKLELAAKDLDSYVKEEIDVEITTTDIANLPEELSLETYNLLSIFIKE